MFCQCKSNERLRYGLLKAHVGFIYTKKLTTDTYGIYRPCVCVSYLIPNLSLIHDVAWWCAGLKLWHGERELLSAILTSQIHFKSQIRASYFVKKNVFRIWLFFWRQARMTATEKHVSMSGREKGPTLEFWMRSQSSCPSFHSKMSL